MEKLIQSLNESIPIKKKNQNLLIATWNIRAFGNLTLKQVSTDKSRPKRDLESIACIAEIIKRFDVVAIQEVKANIKALRETMKILGDDWDFILTDVNRGSAGNGERMAYIFDTRRVQLSGLAGELVIPSEWLNEIDGNAYQNQFVRSPYAVSFRVRDTQFILVTLHIKYGKSSKDRIDELKSIAKMLSKWATKTSIFSKNLIALGDFNIDKRGDLLDKTFLSEGLYVPSELQNKTVTRSIFNKDKYYDQIAWFNGNKKKPALSLDFRTGGNYDFVGQVLENRELSKRKLSWLISDHYPLWAEFIV